MSDGNWKITSKKRGKEGKMKRKWEIFEKEWVHQQGNYGPFSRNTPQLHSVHSQQINNRWDLAEES